MSDQPSSTPGHVLKKRESCEDNTLGLDYWISLWANRLDTWQEENGNTLMWEYMNNVYLKGLKKNPSDVRVFIPLCGKAKDMKILYDVGFTVVGVEYVKQGIDEFFSENRIPRKEHPLEFGSRKFPCVTSEDGRIMIIHGDMFQCGAEDLPFPDYDIIWDRAAFNVLNFSDRPRYAEYEAGVLADDGIILMIAYEYDRSVFGGPPAHVSRECLLQSYDNFCTVAEFDRHDVMDPTNPKREQMLKRGLPPHMYEVLHVMRKH